jgi:hypothetical protein
MMKAQAGSGFRTLADHRRSVHWVSASSWQISPVTDSVLILARAHAMAS